MAIAGFCGEIALSVLCLYRSNTDKLNVLWEKIFKTWPAWFYQFERKGKSHIKHTIMLIWIALKKLFHYLSKKELSIQCTLTEVIERFDLQNTSWKVYNIRFPSIYFNELKHLDRDINTKCSQPRKCCVNSNLNLLFTRELLSVVTVIWTFYEGLILGQLKTSTSFPSGRIQTTYSS